MDSTYLSRVLSSDIVDIMFHGGGHPETAESGPVECLSTLREHSWHVDMFERLMERFPDEHPANVHGVLLMADFQLERSTQMLGYVAELRHRDERERATYRVPVAPSADPGVKRRGRPRRVVDERDGRREPSTRTRHSRSASDQDLQPVLDVPDVASYEEVQTSEHEPHEARAYIRLPHTIGDFHTYESVAPEAVDTSDLMVVQPHIRWDGSNLCGGDVHALTRIATP